MASNASAVQPWSRSTWGRYRRLMAAKLVMHRRATTRRTWRPIYQLRAAGFVQSFHRAPSRLFLCAHHFLLLQSSFVKTLVTTACQLWLLFSWTVHLHLAVLLPLLAACLVGCQPMIDAHYLVCELSSVLVSIGCARAILLCLKRPGVTASRVVL